MKLFDIISLHTVEVVAANSKLHLATSTPHSNPLDEFFAGRFESWQSWQGKKNFERRFIVSLAKLPERDRWLFVGCYRQVGRTWVKTPEPPHWSYQTTEIEECADLRGRVVVDFHRSGRAPYLDADKWASSLNVRQVLERRMSIGEFPGYHRVRLSQASLALIVAESIPSWKGALAAVAGIYLIADSHTGKLYVGSATGTGGIWSRWSQYAVDGHGGNADLKSLLKREGASYSQYFWYAVLEIADTHASHAEVLARESHWKEVLRTREHGYNAN